MLRRLVEWFADAITPFSSCARTPLISRSNGILNVYVVREPARKVHQRSKETNFPAGGIFETNRDRGTVRLAVTRRNRLTGMAVIDEHRAVTTDSFFSRADFDPTRCESYSVNATTYPTVRFYSRIRDYGNIPPVSLNERKHCKTGPISMAIVATRLYGIRATLFYSHYVVAEIASRNLIARAFVKYIIAAKRICTHRRDKRNGNSSSFSKTDSSV